MVTTLASPAVVAGGFQPDRKSWARNIALNKVNAELIELYINVISCFLGARKAERISCLQFCLSERSVECS